MTMKQAISAAQKKSDRYDGEAMFVMSEDGEYFVSDEEGLYTYWDGQDPVACVEDGEITIF